MKTRILIFITLLAMAVIFTGCSGSMIQNDPQNDNPVSIDDLQCSIGSNVIVAIAAGYDHSLALTNDGRVFATGLNGSGQLGLGTTNSTNSWICTASDAKAISVGASHSMYLSTNGTVWVTGDNEFGQLGTKDTDIRLGWTRSPISGVVAIACGSGHSLCLRSNGQVIATGDNSHGQLGVRSYINCKWWKLTGINNAIAIACGSDFSACLVSTGYVLTTGDNTYGQLALGTTGGTKNYWTQTNGNVKAIACGSAHMAYLDNNGYVWATGNNKYGQLALGTFEDDRNIWTMTNNGGGVKAISCGLAHTACLDINGNAYATGWNGFGQLAIGIIGGAVNEWTSTHNGVSISTIACGSYTTFVVTDVGELWSAGNNDWGQLGVAERGNYYQWTKCP